MIIRDDVTFIRHDHAGAKRVLHEGFLIWTAKGALLVAKEEFKGIKTVLPPDADLLRCLDRDDGRNHTADQRAPFSI